jgi:hypothetical protein
MSTSISAVRMKLFGFVAVIAILAFVAFGPHAKPTEASTGGINIDAWCQHLTFGTARAQLLPPYTVYSWACRYIGGQAFGINLNDACKWQYNRSWAWAAYTNYWNAYSWYCNY